MGADGLDDATIGRVLTGTRRIAVVGASAKPWRPSNSVLGFLVDRGYEVTPVNPGLSGQSIRGRPVVGRLSEATPLEMVDVFRNAVYAGDVVDEAVRLDARVVWMQLGVVDHDAAERGRQAGLTVVMDRCPIIEWHRLRLA